MTNNINEANVNIDKTIFYIWTTLSFIATILIFSIYFIAINLDPDIKNHVLLNKKFDILFSLFSLLNIINTLILIISYKKISTLNEIDKRTFKSLFFIWLIFSIIITVGIIVILVPLGKFIDNLFIKFMFFTATSLPLITNIGKMVTISSKSREIEGSIVKSIFFICAALSLITTIGIIVTLASQAWSFFIEVTPWEYLTGTNWSPILKPRSYGVLPLLGGTLLVTFIAILVAIPVGLGTAIFLSEYAPSKIRRLIKPVLEVLAGMPTIVYGYFALNFVTPQLQNVIPDLLIFNALSAGLVMGLMIIPMISSLSEDAMMSVPRSLRQGAYALGATRLEVSLRVVIPAALSGIIAAIILGISRAIGETMLVTIAAGATPRLTLNPLESIQTMTAFIVQLSLGETMHGSLEYNTIFAVGLLLFGLTLSMNFLSHWVVKKWGVRY